MRFANNCNGFQFAKSPKFAEEEGELGDASVEDLFGDDEESESEESVLDRVARSAPTQGPEGRAANKKGKAASKSKRSKGKGRDKEKGSNKVSDLGKYNEYMDAVFNRMNVLIKKKRMDPLRVNLYAGPSNPSSKGKKGEKRKHSPRMDLHLDEEGEEEDGWEEEEDDSSPARKDIFIHNRHNQEEGEEEEEEAEVPDSKIRKIR